MAYVVGVRISSLIESLQDAVKPLIDKLPSRFHLARTNGHIPPQVDNVLNEIVSRHPSGEDGDLCHLRSTYRSCIERAVAEAKFRWPAEAPDLFQEYDRREAERDFAYGISAPLATIAFVLAMTDAGWIWVAVALAIIALLSKHAGFRHQRELERFVLEAIMVGRVGSDLTELLLDWSEKTDRQLVKRSSNRHQCDPASAPHLPHIPNLPST
ncbi:hypothetical protein [Micromonospora sp. NPDC000442]|uniref:hypothetical protein n=1 Tax=Micromonospora sp. NPDC000442 TaxID=3364217 RepID=UPI0036830FAC